MGWLDWLRRELAPFPGREATTVRIVVTVVLVVIISMALQIPQLVLSAYMVFFVTKENKVVTALTGLLLVLGVTIAIAASLLVYRSTFDFPALRVPGMAVVLFLGFYFSRVFVIGPLAFAIGFVLAVTQSIAELVPSAEYLVHSLLWLWVAVGYPIVLTVIVNQLLLPAHPYTSLVRAWQVRLDATAELLERVLGLTAPSPKADRSLAEQATHSSAPLVKLLAHAEIADPPLKRRHPAHLAAIMATERLVTAAAALALRAGEQLTQEDRRCLETARAEATVLRTVLPQPPLPRPPSELSAAPATLPEIHELQHALTTLRESLESDPAGSVRQASPAKPRRRLLVADAFTNPAHGRFALKVTLAAMVCYILYTAVDWPGIHTALITCCIISLESTGSTLRKGALRLAGCVVGGLLGFLAILYFIPRMESIASLALLIAAGSALAGWVAAGGERIAYGGLQIAFAFYTCTLQGFAPDTDLDKIRDRLVGILLGIAVTTLVFRYLWPERAADRLRAVQARTLQSLAQLLTHPQPQSSIELATVESRKLRAEISAGLDEALRLAEVAKFEQEEAEPRDRASSNTTGALIARLQSLFLTANQLASETALIEWQGLPEPVQRADAEWRKGIASEITLVGASLGDTEPGPQTGIEEHLASQDRVAAPSSPGNSHGGRTMLLERAATQARQISIEPPVSNQGFPTP